MNYKFYTYNNKATYHNSLQEAIQALKDNNSESYLSLGVEKENAACDLVIKENGNYRISNDYIYTSFKNDSLITINTIEILKREFGV